MELINKWNLGGCHFCSSIVFQNSFWSMDPKRILGFFFCCSNPTSQHLRPQKGPNKSRQVSVKRLQVINFCGLSANWRSLHSQVTRVHCFLSLCQSVSSFSSSLYLRFYSLIIFDLISVMVGFKQQKFFNVHFYVTFLTGLALISGNNDKNNIHDAEINLKR